MILSAGPTSVACLSKAFVLSQISKKEVGVNIYFETFLYILFILIVTYIYPQASHRQAYFHD